MMMREYWVNGTSGVVCSGQEVEGMLSVVKKFKKTIEEGIKRWEGEVDDVGGGLWSILGSIQNDYILVYCDFINLLGL